MLARLLPSLTLVAITTTLTAQVTMYIAPQASSINGHVESGFMDALSTSGQQRYNDLESPSLVPTGSPSQMFVNWPGQALRLNHRDDAQGALTGTLRDWTMDTYTTTFGTDRGMTSRFGTTTSRDMIEILFAAPVAHFGAHFIDIESAWGDSATLRAYDDTDTLMFEREVLLPNGEDGENATNNAIHFIGFIGDDDDVWKVTISVGNTLAQVAAGNDDYENIPWLGMLDVRCGTAPRKAGRLQTTFSNNTWLGGVDGTLCFDVLCTAPNGITIDRIDMNFQQPAGTPGTFALRVSPDSGATWSGIVATGQATSSGPGLPTSVTLSDGVALSNACSYRFALVSYDLSHQYTNSNALPDTYGNQDVVVSGGYSIDAGGVVYSPRTPNIVLHYQPGGACLPFARADTVGVGCVRESASVYEEFAPGQVDLSVVYVVAEASATALQAGYLPVQSQAIQLSLGDDDQIAVGSLGVVVGSNGWVAAGSGNSNYHEPSVATMLANPATALYAWQDLDPTAIGSGKIWYKESVGSGGFGSARVWFDGVYAYGTTEPVQFVMILSLLNGEIISGSIRFKSGFQAASGTNVLVGYSPGGPNLDLGPIDMSFHGAASPAPLSSTDVAPLRLTAVTLPIQGQAAVPFEVTTSDIPAGALFHLGLVGLTSPGLPLDVIIGAPECFLYAGLDVIRGPVVQPVGSVTWSPLTLPAITTANFSGFEFYAQSVILGTTENNALNLGVLTSNGLRCVIGTDLVPPGRLVINEVDYDQPGTDSGEFVEIYNTGGTAVDLTNVALDLHNGVGGAIYDTIALSSAAASLAPGEYLVIGTSTLLATLPIGTPTVQFTNAANNMQNGSPDGMVLRDGTAVLDALSYEGTMTGVTEGGGGAPADSNGTAGSIQRLPNGTDTDDNAVDFAFAATTTPGAAN